MNHSVIKFLSAMAVAALPAVAGAETEYRLSAGDVVRFSVVGLRDLTTEIPVDLGGTIYLPFAGAVPASGKTIGELNSSVSDSLDGQMYRFLTNDGRDGIITIDGQDVQISIVAYRPVAVYGAVGKPGEVVYRSGMTVRHAIAIAGGLRAMPLDGMLGMRSAELLGEINVLRVRKEYLHDVAQRLEAELESLVRNSYSRERDTSPGADVELSERQRVLLTRRLAAAESERTHIARLIAQQDERLGVLSERERTEAASVAADAEEQERLENLLTRGIVSKDRVSDMRRVQLLSATRLLQTQDAIARAEFDRMNLERDLIRAGNERLIELTETLESTEMEIAQLEEKIAALRQQLFALSGTDVESGKDDVLAVLIHRQTGDAGTKSQVASLDDPLEPGDVLEVLLGDARDGALSAHGPESWLSDGSSSARP